MIFAAGYNGNGPAIVGPCEDVDQAHRIAQDELTRYVVLTGTDDDEAVWVARQAWKAANR